MVYKTLRSLRLCGVLLFLCVSGGMLAGCGEEPPAVRLAPITGGDQEPTMLFEGFHMVSTHAQEVEWEFYARAAQIYEKNHLAKAQDIKVVYWRDGKIVSTLTARRGIIRTDNNDMRAEEDVVLVSHEGVKLYTERLNWNQEGEKLYTDLPVKIVRQGSVLTGVGLEADSELKHVNVLADVNIRVKSLKELENFQAAPGPEKNE